MKRVSLVLILSVFTQIILALSPVDFGFNFQLNMPKSSFDDTDWSEVSNRLNLSNINEVLPDVGYAGGIFLRLNIDESFIQSEAMFAFDCFDVEGEDVEGEEFQETVEKTSLEVPVFLGSNLIDGSAFKLKLFTGPTFSWLMESSSLDAEVLDVDDLALRDFKWFWSVGAGFELFMFSFDARYSHDMAGIHSTEQLENSFDKPTNMVKFTLGFRIF